MKKREKAYLLLTILFFLLLLVKSFWIDGVSPTNAEQIRFAQWVNHAMLEEFGDGAYSRYIVKNRLVKIEEKTREDEKIVFIGKVRRYLFGIIPFQEKYVAEEKKKFEK